MSVRSVVGEKLWAKVIEIAVVGLGVSYLGLWYCFGFVLYKITPLRALPLFEAVPSGGNSGKLLIDGKATAQTPLFGLVWFDAGDTDNPSMERLTLTHAFWCFCDFIFWSKDWVQNGSFFKNVSWVSLWYQSCCFQCTAAVQARLLWAVNSKCLSLWWSFLLEMFHSSNEL